MNASIKKQRFVVPLRTLWQQSYRLPRRLLRVLIPLYDSPGQDPPLTRELLGRMLSALLMLSSLVAMATLVLPATTPINRVGVFWSPLPA